MPPNWGIVAAPSGRMWADNRPGGGTATWFTLPLPGTPPQVAPEGEITDVPKPGPAWGRRNIGQRMADLRSDASSALC